ncbi:MAG: glycosyltransferase family 39 protein [Acidobacteriota bacterium]|nr:glycosyltransferase family 39 protein [Acidobacteriota bacterium]
MVTTPASIIENRLRKQRYLWSILVIAFASRLGLSIAVWGNPAAALGPDSWSYMEPARNLLTTGAFWRGGLATGQPELLRTPGYPLFLLLFGLGQNYSYGLIQIAQVGLGVAIVFLTYALGARLVNRTVGLWAAGLQSISIGSVLSSIWIMSDCLFSFLLALALLMLVRYFQEGSGWPIPLAAALTAAATYVRPVGMVFVPLVLAVLLLFRPREWARAAAFALIFAALVTPWYVRNHSAGYDGFSSVGDQNLLSYEGPGVLAVVEKIPVKQAKQELEDFHARRIRDLNVRPDSGPAMKLASEIAKRIVFAHPLVWLQVHLVTSLNAMLPATPGMLQSLGITQGYKGTLAVLQRQGLAAAIKIYFGGNLKALLLVTPELILLAIEYGLCALFAFVTIRRHKLNWGRAGWLMALTVLAFIFVSGTTGMPRFRVPVEPLLNIAAAGGLMSIAGRTRENGLKSGRAQNAVVPDREALPRAAREAMTMPRNVPMASIPTSGNSNSLP